MRLGRSSRAFVAAVVLLGAVAVVGRPQQQTISPSARQMSPSAQQEDRNKVGADPDMVSIEQRQVRARNDERQRRLVADSDKLLALATQLHEDVNKTNKNILSLDVVKRAEEIEKLARSVKERMKG